MNKNLLLLLLTLLLLVVSVLAETPSYQILTYPFSNRAAAMGGSSAVDPSGNIDIQGNPAGASFVENIKGQVGFINHIVGIRGYSAGGTLPMDNHRISGELIYFDYGIFDKTDIYGANHSTFGFHELAASLGYAFIFSDAMRLGARVGRFQRMADGNSYGEFFYDLGAVYHKTQDSLTVGIYLKSIALGESEESFPTQLRIGSSKILSHLPLRINLDGIYNLDDKLQFALGAEIFVHPNFRARLGVNSNRFDLQTGVTESDFIAGASVGFAFNYQGVLIESASQSFGAAGWVNQISLAYSL